MNLLNFEVIFLILYVLIIIIFGFRVEHDGTVLEYWITNLKQCSVSDNVIRHFVDVSLDQCVYHCGTTNNCDVITYKRHYGLCELRTLANDNGVTDKVKKCVTVQRSDITVLKLSNTTETCNSEEGHCHAKECPRPQLENGHFKGNMFDVGSTLEIECDAGYQAVPNINRITCLPNGSWSHVIVCGKVRFYCPNNYNYGLHDLYANGVRIDSKTSIVFQTKGSSNAHVLLQESRTDETNNVVEIVFGGWSNGKSVIRNQKQGPNLAQYEGAVLNPESYTWFWISWDGGCVQVGKGSAVGSDRIMEWCGLTYSFAGIGISYGYGSDGYFKFTTNE